MIGPLTLALLPLLASAQGTPPTCEDGYTIHNGANGMPYCLLDGVPSISNRKPEDAKHFLPTGCSNPELNREDREFICEREFAREVADPRLNGGRPFDFVCSIGWQSLQSDALGSVEYSVHVTGAAGGALFGGRL